MKRVNLRMSRVSLAGESARLPRMVPYRQRFEGPALDTSNIGRVVAAELARPDIALCIRPGMRIAVGVGSRGIAHLSRIVKAVVDELKRAGAEPFLVPAMGSHGGATAGGQTELLAGYGITEEAMGAPVAASMDTVRLGSVLDGVEVHFDRWTVEHADGIVAVARVKPHTDFKADIESGIVKMLGIGFGKHKGASFLHRFGMERFGELLPEVGRLILQRTPFLFGLAIVENAQHETAILEAVPGERLLSREAGLLAEAKRLMPRLWLDDIDVLVVDRIGKNISGSGMDPNVIGRSGAHRRFGDGPAIGKIVVRGLTPETKGSAVGIGIADFTTFRVAEQIDFGVTYTNVMTAMDVTGGKLPVMLANDRDAVTAAVMTAGRRNPEQARIVRIRDTLSLTHIWLSEPMAAEAAAHPMMDAAGRAEEWVWDEAGNITADEKETGDGRR